MPRSNPPWKTQSLKNIVITVVHALKPSSLAHSLQIHCTGLTGLMSYAFWAWPEKLGPAATIYFFSLSSVLLFWQFYCHNSFFLSLLSSYFSQVSWCFGQVRWRKIWAYILAIPLSKLFFLSFSLLLYQFSLIFLTFSQNFSSSIAEIRFSPHFFK